MVLRDLEGTQKAAGGKTGRFSDGNQRGQTHVSPQMPRGVENSWPCNWWMFSCSLKALGDVLPYISLDSQKIFGGFFFLEFLLGVWRWETLETLVVNLLVLMRRERYLS